jgi:hypothetical protein
VGASTVDEAKRRRRDFIRANHPDRGGDVGVFVAGLQLFGEQPESSEPPPRVVVVSHRSWPVHLKIAIARRLRPGKRVRRVR